MDLVLDVIAMPTRMMASEDFGDLATRQIGGRRGPGQNPALRLLQIALLVDGGDPRVDRLIVGLLVVIVVNRGAADDGRNQSDSCHAHGSAPDSAGRFKPECI